jgi:hypothetical protein
METSVLSETSRLNCGFDEYRADSALPPAVKAVQQPLALLRHIYLSLEGASDTGEFDSAESVKFWLDDGSDCSEMTTV